MKNMCFLILVLLFTNLALANGKEFTPAEIEKILLCRGEKACIGDDGRDGPCYAGFGGPLYNGFGGPCFSGFGGPLYEGYGGRLYAGYGGYCYKDYGGPCYAGYGGNCYEGITYKRKKCPLQCKTVCK